MVIVGSKMKALSTRNQRETIFHKEGEPPQGESDPDSKSKLAPCYRCPGGKELSSAVFLLPGGLTLGFPESKSGFGPLSSLKLPLIVH